MADGLNDARSMRIAEVMNDFRLVQHRIAQCQAPPPPGEEGQIGYVMLRSVHTEAQALLARPFNPPGGGGSSSPEQLKRQLQRVLLDASARRFNAHKLSLRAAAAYRWHTRRRQILGTSAPTAAHAQALGQNDVHLRNAISAITDQQVYNELRSKDTAAGNWLAEMADLKTLLAYIRSMN